MRGDRGHHYCDCVRGSRFGVRWTRGRRPVIKGGSIMTTSLPDQASCPGCFKRVAVADATTCAACGAAVWADGRLLLVAPVEEGRASMFRGLLRGDGDGSASGLEEVVVKVLDVGGLPDWRDYE